MIIPPTYMAADQIVGGGERYALEYARTLSRLTPTTLALFDRAPHKEWVDALEIRTFEAGDPEGRLNFPLPRSTLRALAEYDILHSMGFPTALADRLLLLGVQHGIPVVLTDVGGGSRCWSTYLRRIHSRLDLNRLAAGIAPLSDHSGRKFHGWGQPSTILGGGVHPAPSVCAPPADGYVLFVGRLLPHKGVLELIESLDPLTPLHVVGRPYDPEYFARLERAARGRRVRFILDADDEELRRQYAGASVVTQPSLPVPGTHDNTELLGLVTLEGMAAGRAVIVTRAGSLPELVLDGVNGFVVTPGDREELRNRIGQILADPALAARMGSAGRKRALEKYSWEGAADRGLGLYRQLLGGRTP